MKTYDTNVQSEAALEGEDPYAEEQDQEAALQKRLAAFGSLVQGWVDEAIAARESSGIEARWREDLKQYYGEEVGATQRLTLAEQAAVAPSNTQVRSGERQTKSKVVVNITRPKTNAAIARMSDMLLPTDDKNWGIQPTPDPKLSEDLNDQTALTHGGQPLQTEGGQPVTAGVAASTLMEQATTAAKAMEREIDDQLTECNWNAEQRKGLWDLCVLGTVIYRIPFAKTRVSRKWQRLPGPDGQMAWQMIETTDTVPAGMRVSPWRFYPDPSAGGEIQNSRYTVESDDYNTKMLRRLRKQDDAGYLTDQIDLCLKEGPKSSRRTSRANERRYVDGEYIFDDRNTFEVYIVHGEFTRGDLADAGVDECGCKPGEDDGWREEGVDGCVILCNGRVIKAFVNPLYSGDLPYSVAVYEKIDGQMFGAGIPFVLRNPQRVVTAAWRITLDNAALSAGGQIVMKRNQVEPADGSWNITGTKLWFAKDGVEDVQKAFYTFQFEGRQQELMQIFDKAMQLAEDESNMPAIMEGSTTDAPETVGVATAISNNANTVLRRLVKTYDDDITDPSITRMYDWNMQYSDKDEIKGDFQIDARGSSVLLVRDLQKQALAQMSTLVLHPVLGQFHLRRGYDWLRSLYESNHITPDSVLIPDEKVQGVIEQMDKAAQQQPQDPRIAAAQIKAQSDQQLTTAKLQDAERERLFDHQKWQDQYQLELIRYANEHSLSLEQVKAAMTELLLKARHEERMQQTEAALKMKYGSGL